MYAIEFDSVSKRYLLGSSVRSIRDAFGSALNRLRGARHDFRKELWALRGVSFGVGKGQVLGIIGPNGAGKSTILKLLSSITKPTSGTIRIRGRVSALIEVGAGFHPELSGRENIFLNGCILGMGRKEIQQKFDEIVDFSGLEGFMETPVKRYSSGMYVRLGFAVAAHMDPQVLLIDEVLAVGDFTFQGRCMRKMAQIAKSGATLIFVSHNLSNVKLICKEALCLIEGTVVSRGDPETVVAAYRSHKFSSREGQPISLDASQKTGDGSVEIESVELLGDNGMPVESLRTGDELTVRVSYFAKARIPQPQFSVSLRDDRGMLLAGFVSGKDGFQVEQISGRGVAEVRIPRLSLMPGTLELSVAILDSSCLHHYVWHDRCYRLDIVSGVPGRGLLYLPHEWRHTAGATP
jgi:ABC-type polysaccharide/polyol phosphate transport system ATPase subunit